MTEITDNGIHPMRPGISVELGDYGYFKNGLWFRMGNITSIRGLRCSLHVRFLKDLKDDCIFRYGINFMTGADVNANCGGNGISCGLGFSKNNSFFVRALIEEIHEFDSVDIEVKEQIKRLENAGIWESEYCVVTSVLLASRFVSVFSSAKDCGVDLSASIDGDVSFDNIDASVGITAGGNNKGVEFVNHLNSDQLSPVGFRTVAWTRNLVGFGKKVIKYVGDDVSSFCQTDREAESDSEPTIFNNLAQ